MSWPSVPIESVSVPTSLRDPRRGPASSFRYIDISSIDRHTKSIATAPDIPSADAPSRARKAVLAGDILVSTVRPNLNTVALVPRELDDQIASTGFCVLRPNPKVILGKYLFYFSTTPEFVDALTSKVRGAHYPAVSDADVKSVSIPVTKTLSVRMKDEEYRFLSALAEEEREDVSTTLRGLLEKGRVLLAIEKYRRAEASLEKAAGLARLRKAW